MAKTEIRQIKILRDMPFGRKKGDVVKVEVDRNGIPLNRYWRDRLKDSAIDGCCELVKKSKSTDKAAGDNK